MRHPLFSSMENTVICSTVGCGKPSSMQCPTCITLKCKPHHFCSQECFKGFWKQHQLVHSLQKKINSFEPPMYPYTGPLRPHYVTQGRPIPSTIECPDYFLDGIPESENSSPDKHTAPIYTAEEIAGIRAACVIGRGALDAASRIIKVGITTDEIDEVVHNYIVSKGAYPSPWNYHSFPKSVCTSVNEVICHGIPDMRPLEDGDIVNVDVSVFLNGYHGDLNETFVVGNVDFESKKLIKLTHDATMAAIRMVKPGTLIRDFGETISLMAHKVGYSVVKSYCGHGIGHLFHCAPNIYHYARNKGVGSCKPGMIFTIEPMINMGVWRDQLWTDDWTVVTVDGKRSAQFEHTILVTEDGFEILTGRTEESAPLWWELPEEAENLKRCDLELYGKK